MMAILFLLLSAFGQAGKPEFQIINQMEGLPKDNVISVTTTARGQMFKFMFPCYPNLTTPASPCVEPAAINKGLIGAYFAVETESPKGAGGYVVSAISFSVPGRAEIRVEGPDFKAASDLRREAVKAGKDFAALMKEKKAEPKAADVFEQMNKILRARLKQKDSKSG
jgi:hypothetical protein